MSKEMDERIQKVMDRIHASDIVPLLHGKPATAASEYAATLFDLCIDHPEWTEDGLPFRPSVINREFEKGNLGAAPDYEALLKYAAEKCGSTKEAIESIESQEGNWINGADIF